MELCDDRYHNNPAFPVHPGNIFNDQKKGTIANQFGGMTIRQYFVAQAMAGLLAGIAVRGKVIFSEDAIEGEESYPLSKNAVEFADACLAEEKRTRKEGGL